MKIYTNGEKTAIGRHVLICHPGSDPVVGETVAEWRDIEGKPTAINVEFLNGAAEVEDNLGKFLIDKGYASKKLEIEPYHTPVIAQPVMPLY
jgi:hypothetical protein